MDEIQRRVDEIRKASSEVENNLIDSLRGGRISRREFIRRGTVVGMSFRCPASRRRVRRRRRRRRRPAPLSLRRDWPTETAAGTGPAVQAGGALRTG
jgi:hypothetical protein